MHDGGGDRSETVAALPVIIQELEQRGFQFVTIQRMVLDLQRHDGTTDKGAIPFGSPILLELSVAWMPESWF